MRLAEPLALLPRGLVEAELARRVARLEALSPRCRTAARACPLRSSTGTFDEQLDRGPREHAAVAGRRVERRAPRDLAKVVVLDDQHDRARAQLLIAQPHRDAIGLVEQDHGELAFVVDVVVERLLMTDRDRLVLGRSRAA